ncbi:GAF domain-containing protein [Anabaena cylindrica FACHB-243]|uniref:Circadian input-output histidine kinase CikA n=1 Tax=Anabaena cylindrica (strain ATCC 27899 / PCC 7122) TaxID=272123 RepID=K9ZMP7_ANACC|nr:MULTISPECIES: GAF domain-containing protein [Anabaena]AFZ60064.1 multi-sensor hybrid histidine kinase [Anabaena cylindrica PCC 7122]MBD2417880.1 GAF domain-containing protein [Anabaena cylindrica FACHB-243]MBY5282539.1 GAF domain-containing protein [Anabaena sp. CCAP 1446/1C]MBY5310692.1 GAF domain-containing protein [Anabaena sp. CCAP 1446/1C]MCM2404796.1 GAF domain-containing protein [Anabaena sp. CCAP 1446/1C]
MFSRSVILTPSELKSAIIRNPLIVKPETTVIDAIAMLAAGIGQMGGVGAISNTKIIDGQLDELHLETRPSCVLVMEDGKLLGIFTERDVVRLISQQHSLENLVIQDVMTYPVVTLYESAFSDLFSTINLLQQYHIRHIPILNEQDCVVGLVTDESLRQISNPIYPLRSRLVSAAMTNEVICAALDSSIRTIVQLMAKNCISCVIIVQKRGSQAQPLQIPVGIITEQDIVKFQVLGLNLETSQAETVMSAPIFSVKPNDSLEMVQQIMEQQLIRKLAVTNEEGNLLGIVTQNSLLQTLNPLELYKLAEVLEEKVLRLEAEKILLLETRTVELEKELADQNIALQTKTEQEKLVAIIATQIRSSLNLQTILDTTVEQIRQLLNCDRVTIWQLEANGKLITVAESTGCTLSLLGQQSQDQCISQQLVEIYQQGKIRIVPDIYTTEMSDCHRNLLISLDIRAKILMPLMCGDELWGFLNVTESQHPRQWQDSEIELLKLLTVQLAIALQQATTHQKLQEELRERQRAESTLQKLVTGTAAVTGDDFFPALVQHIAEALDVSYAIVTELVGDQLHTLGFWANGSLQPSVSYYAAHTPCKYALRDGQFYCKSGIQEAFANDFDLVMMRADSYLGIALKDDLGNAIGNLCILDVQPLHNSQLKEARDILQVFAARAAAELQRKIAKDALISLNHNLELRIEQRTTKLQAREAQLRDLFDNATDLIQSISLNGRILFVNKSWKEALGYDDTDLEKLSIFQVIHPDELVHCQTVMASLASGNPSMSMETRFLTKDGREIIVEGNVNCQFAKGKPIATRGVFRDITQRKQAELALEEAQQFLYTVLDTFPLFIFWKNRESVYLGCNQNFAISGGFASPAEVIGKTDDDFPWRNGEADIYRADDRQVIESGIAKLGIIETQQQTNGSTIWLETNKLPLRNLKGEVIGILGTYQDITERKQAENALQNSELRFRRMFDSSVVGMIFADFQGRILDTNDRFLQMLGYTRDDFNAGAINWLAITPSEYIPTDFAAIDHLMKYGEIDPWEKAYYRQDGSRIPVLIGAAILPESKDQTICVVVDISEQKAALRERQEAELSLQQEAMYKQLLLTLSQAIRESLEIEVILNTSVNEARSLLVVDRVAVYRFQPDWSGEFITEAVVPGWVKLAAESDVKKVWQDTYLQETQGGRFRNYETLIVRDIYQAGLQPCHIELLEQFQARAYVITPIFVGESLWGLLGMYQNDQPYWWTTGEIELLQQIASQLAIAIYQANLYQQVQAELIIRQKAELAISHQLQQQRTLGKIVQKIRDSLDIKDILATVTQEIKNSLNCDRVIVFRLFADGESQIVEEAVSGELVSLKNRHWDNEVWSQEILDYYWQGQPRIVTDVMEDIWTDCLVEYSIEGQVQSKIVAPILQEAQDGEKNRWVASGENNKLWGVLVVHACSEKRIWKDCEAQLLQQIANQLAIAIQQANLFEKLQQELTERQKTEIKLTHSNQQLAISNEELARATRLKDEFLANMSHELRTPLNAILGMTEALQEQVFGGINERQLKALKTVENSGNHLLELINDILDLAKIEAGQINLNCTSISVSHLCQSSLAFIKQQALKKRIKLNIKLPQNLPDLFVDERRIRQVLINLLNNGVKFTPQGGSITLEVTQFHPDMENADFFPQGFLRITVIDTGIGISPENINRLFHPFIQIDSSLSRQYNGTGLGLALVKQIVELHGGQVGLTSELGVGSCFMIDLPCSPLLSEITTDDQSASTSELDFLTAEEAESQAPLILLAEDNEANIITFSSYLEAKGYQIILARDGHEAVNLAKTHQPNLILMDIQMPGMDGLEAMTQIRLDPKLINIPIIALTALAMTGDRERCLEAGANDYLTKPVMLKQLATTIQQLLNKDG